MKIEIRSVKIEEFAQIIEIKHECWRHDYNKVVPKATLRNLNAAEDTIWLQEWIADETDDLRIILGVIVDNQLVGFVAASSVEECDAEYDAEVNMLFVSNKYRGMGLGLKLLEEVMKFFGNGDVTSVMLYNWRELDSNQFYRNIGGKVVKEQIQNCGGKELVTDIFAWQIDELLAILRTKLVKYS